MTTNRYVPHPINRGDIFRAKDGSRVMVLGVETMGRNRIISYAFELDFEAPRFAFYSHFLAIFPHAE